ncbi:hypothetical protein OIE49_36765 [Streptomyces sp. NBC_01788]|uniref:hypothetical protein n=1 Tax=Streptomyces sp. NBC_01788 TaxID=2975940 RepID=UPI002DD81E7E|nr:hypothetical protein [Streptomyces sp. NBC_01788]WSB30943.1 hypothetical protein OIE49_36765 [Streptomyces sp. NBC_01788]
MEAVGKRKRILRSLVEIVFEDAELARVCNNGPARRDRLGPDGATTLLRRLGQMSAAHHLADLRHIAATRLRPAANGDCFTLLVSLGDHGDLVVRPRDDPPDTLDDGTLNEHAVRGVIVAAIHRP